MTRILEVPPFSPIFGTPKLKKKYFQIKKRAFEAPKVPKRKSYLYDDHNILTDGELLLVMKISS